MLFLEGEIFSTFSQNQAWGAERGGGGKSQIVSAGRVYWPISGGIVDFAALGMESSIQNYPDSAGGDGGYGLSGDAHALIAP